MLCVRYQPWADVRGGGWPTDLTTVYVYSQAYCTFTQPRIAKSPSEQHKRVLASAPAPVHRGEEFWADAPRWTAAAATPKHKPGHLT